VELGFFEPNRRGKMVLKSFFPRRAVPSGMLGPNQP